MWLFLSSGFLSIVDKCADPESLLVRARRSEHIRQYFPNAEIVETIGNDYQFRAVVKRQVIADVITAQVMSLDYNNFKNSIKNLDLHHAASKVWHTMADLQPAPPYAIAKRSRRK